MNTSPKATCDGTVVPSNERHSPLAATSTGFIARSEAIGDLVARLARATSTLRNLEPAGHNSHYGFRFVALHQLTEPIRLALAAEQVFVFPSIARWDEDQTKQGTKVVVHVHFTFSASSGEFVTINCVGVGVDRGDKYGSKAMASATKMMLRRCFLISSADPREDPDTSSPEQDAPARRGPWNRFELDSEIETLLSATEVGDELVERFRSYLLDVYGVNTWSDFAHARLVAIRDRLRSLGVEERRKTIETKVADVSDAA